MNKMRFYFSCLSIIICLVNLTAQTQYAKIVVYRNETINEKVEEEFKIFANENLTTSLKNYHFEEFYMPEGSFKLKANEIYPTVSKVDCYSGRTYYFRINRNFSLPDKPITIVGVDSITANNEIKYLRTNFVRKNRVIDPERKNGIGFEIEPGVGFEKVGLLGTTDGTLVMHSFGGGAAFGLTYSHKFNDYFGWSAELQKQFSILNPALTNASVTFNQGVLSATPYFTIPVTIRNEQQIKIGGGIDYRFGCVLNIETKKLLNGFDDNWTYKNTCGFHLITFYEGMLGSNLRGHVGFKYSDVRYTFVSGETYRPTDPKLKTPGGDSLSVSLGLEYCF